ncbi:restriction endonuclease subunit S [Kribbella sp. NPDC003505]|uniref:restriction endonuclease subunit S n=1 Tax=Kribbella sp. NPDC003505 TaxID=3154448 RepID=UPI0033AC4DF5
MTVTEQMSLGGLVVRGDLALSDGYRTRADQLGSTGVPILRVADVLDGRIEPSFKDFIREEFRPKMGAKVSRAGDVLITTKGTVGRIARVPDGLPEHSYSPQLCFLRTLNADAVHPTWLYHWARSSEFLGQLGLYKDQTDMAPYVSLTDLRQVRMSLPPIAEQQRISELMEPLDALVERNRKEIEIAVELAYALFARVAGGEPDPGGS